MSIFTQAGLVGRSTPQLGVKEITPPQVVKGTGLRTYTLTTCAGWGPDAEVVTVANMGEYEEKLGGFEQVVSGVNKYQTIGFHMARLFLAYGNSLKVVRAVGPSKAKAAVTVPDSTAGAPDAIVGTAVYYGIRGNEVVPTISAVDALAGTFTLTQTLRGKQEKYEGCTLANIADKTKASKMATWAPAAAAVGLPVAATYALTGGNSGLDVDAAGVLGVNTLGVKTGLELAKTVSSTRYLDTPHRLAGVNAALNTAAAELTAAHLWMPTDESVDVDDAVTLKGTQATSDRAFPGFNYFRVYESTINEYVNVPVSAGMAALLSVLPIHYSISQQPQDPDAAPFNADDVLFQLSEAEVETLTAAGINPVTVVDGQGIIFRSGYNGSTNAAVNQIYRRTITDEIGRAFKTNLKFAVSKPNTKNLRKRVAGAMSTFLQVLKEQEIIEDFFVQCDETNNTPASQALHMLFANAKVKLFAMADLVEIGIEVGHTVTFR
jgi:hypothetical protein